MTITVTELRKHLGKYLDLSQSENVFIKKRGKVIAMFTSNYEEKIALVDSLVGVLQKEVTITDGKEEWIYRHEKS